VAKSDVAVSRRRPMHVGASAPHPLVSGVVPQSARAAAAGTVGGHDELLSVVELLEQVQCPRLSCCCSSNCWCCAALVMWP
jgi:hypothetical protein